VFIGGRSTSDTGEVRGVYSSPSAKNWVSPMPESGTPQRVSSVAVTCRLIAPSSASDRLRCSRTPRLTCAMASRPSRS
jgi:hypothetical protein